MIVHYCELECRSKRVHCYFHGQCHVKGSTKKSYCFVCQEPFTYLQPNFVRPSFVGNIETFVCNQALWETMKKYNIVISTNLIQVIKNLYNKATSAVLINSSIGDWFQTTVQI